MDWNLFFTSLVNKYGPPLGLLLLLLVVDIGTGIGSAVKRGEFRWRLVANFYRTNIMPNVVGWVMLTILSEGLTLGLSAYIPDAYQGLVATLLPAGGYGLVFANLLSSITLNMREINAPPGPPPSDTPITDATYKPKP